MAFTHNSLSHHLPTRPSPSSPFPFNSLCFLVFESRNHSSVGLRTLKFGSSVLNHAIQVDTQLPERSGVAVETARKKRKPRPSFSEQIREKWSLKLSSTREKFPWQEHEENVRQEGEQDLGQTPESSGFGSPESECDVKIQVSEIVGSELPNRSILAPWSHGNKLKESRFDFSGERGEEVNIVAKIDSASIGLSGSEKNVISQDVNGVSLNENQLVADSNDDSIRLPWKRERDLVEVKSVSVKEKGLVADGNSGSIALPWKRERDLVRVNSVSVKEKGLVADGNSGSIALPWKRDESRRSKTQMAETMIPEHELRRLRNVALRMVERIKVGAAGITKALVGRIHEKWEVDEVVKLKFEQPCSLQMRRTHELLEKKTGGLVIWRSGSSVVLHRGMTYELSCVQSFTKHSQEKIDLSLHLRNDVNEMDHNIGGRDSLRETASVVPDSEGYLKNLSEEEFKELTDLNQLLDELGPRFEDWSGREPLPVDADLLPSVVPGYKSPFRLLPYGSRSSLTNKEMTDFRRFARTTPPHFALGRNRELQGLAKAMVKLWERSAIAKIAIKRGVLNTCNERMAEELKRLTGGTLLSRNKEFIVFYRGNDFMTPNIVEALEERRKLTYLQQDEEEQARQMASLSIDSNENASRGPLVAGTLSETIAAVSRWGSQPNSEDIDKMMSDSVLSKHASLVSYLEKKLVLAKRKIRKAEKALAKVLEYLEPSELPTDVETLSDEERFLFRKIGLSMKPYLLLGRREIFDGTIENMHLHWKYRELVKIIVRGKNFAQLKHIAIALEAESGGVLVCLDKTTKGYAIVIYRGKNYLKPRELRPKNLLTRRRALARSIELQRREALKHHISDLEKRIGLMKSELCSLQEELKTKRTNREKSLYSRPDDDDHAYVSDDDVEEAEGEEAYLEVYDSSNEDSNSYNE